MLRLSIDDLDSLSTTLQSSSDSCAQASASSVQSRQSLEAGGLIGNGGVAAISSVGDWGSLAASISEGLAAGSAAAASLVDTARSIKAACEAVPPTLGGASGPSDSGTVAVQDDSAGLPGQANELACTVEGLVQAFSSILSLASGLSHGGGQIVSLAEDGVVQCNEFTGKLDSYCSAVSNVNNLVSETENFATGDVQADSADTSPLGYQICSDFTSPVVQIGSATQSASDIASNELSLAEAFILTTQNIARAGKITRTADGYLIFSGYKMTADNTVRMTTRCLASNVENLERPSAALASERLSKTADVLGKVAVVMDTTVGAYDEYQADADLSEPARWGETIAQGAYTFGRDLLANAAGEAVGVAVTDALIDAEMGATIGAAAGPLGVVAGIAVGVGVSVVTDTIWNAPVDSDKTVGDEVKGWVGNAADEAGSAVSNTADEAVGFFSGIGDSTSDFIGGLAWS